MNTEGSHLEKSSNNPKSSPAEDKAYIQSVFHNYKSLQMIIDTPPLDLQVAIKAMSTQQNMDSNKYNDILLGRDLETFQNDMKE
jgi:hypothetical protein